MFGFSDLRQAIPLREHHHPGSYEFVYIEKGTAGWKIREQTYTTRAGDVFHTKPDELHMGNFSIIEPCRFWWIILQAPHESGWLRLTPEESRAFAAHLVQLPRVVNAGVMPMGPLHSIEEALTLTVQTDFRGVQIRQALIQLLLIFLRPQKTGSMAEDVRERLSALTKRMDEAPEWRPSVIELASFSGVSPSHFFRLFREFSGLTPMAYIERSRISLACRRLAESDVPVTRLAVDLGFQSSQHFATVFKRLTGKTPSAWRQEGHGSTLRQS
jgi:AraC-like DNA-binding protein